MYPKLLLVYIMAQMISASTASLHRHIAASAALPFLTSCAMTIVQTCRDGCDPFMMIRSDWQEEY